MNRDKDQKQDGATVDVETIRWLPLTSLRIEGVEDLNKFGLSTWDLKQDLGLRQSDQSQSCPHKQLDGLLSTNEVAMALLQGRKHSL